MPRTYGTCADCGAAKWIYAPRLGVCRACYSRSLRRDRRPVGSTPAEWLPSARMPATVPDLVRQCSGQWTEWQLTRALESDPTCRVAGMDRRDAVPVWTRSRAAAASPGQPAGASS